MASMTTKTGGRVLSNHPLHPGKVLVEDLGAREMSQRELARQMGRPLKTVNAIARGRKSITARTALDLERVLGVPADFWLNLQTAYDLTVARLDVERTA